MADIKKTLIINIIKGYNMILSIVRKTKSKGKILTSNKMEVDENLLSLWLLNMNEHQFTYNKIYF